MKKIMTLMIILSVMLATMGLVVAGKGIQTQTQTHERTSNGNAQHLYLYEKNPSDWSIVEGGAWGKMMYQDDKFVFNGHGLEAGANYKLISYGEDWPGCGSVELGEAEIADDDGNVHIMGAYGLCNE